MSGHINDHIMDVVGPAINDGLAAYFSGGGPSGPGFSQGLTVGNEGDWYGFNEYTGGSLGVFGDLTNKVVDGFTINRFMFNAVTGICYLRFTTTPPVDNLVGVLAGWSDLLGYLQVGTTEEYDLTNLAAAQYVQGQLGNILRAEILGSVSGELNTNPDFAANTTDWSGFNGTNSWQATDGGQVTTTKNQAPPSWSGGIQTAAAVRFATVRDELWLCEVDYRAGAVPAKVAIGSGNPTNIIGTDIAAIGHEFHLVASNASLPAGSGSMYVIPNNTSANGSTQVIGYAGRRKVTRILANFTKFDPQVRATIMVLSENNDRVTSNSAANRGMALSDLGVLSGKWYWEMLSLTSATAQGMGIGQYPGGSNINEYLGSGAADWGYFPTGAYWNNALNVGTGLAYGVNDIIGFALDMSAGGNLTAYVNGVQSFSVPHGLTGKTRAGGSDSSTGGVCDMVINGGGNPTFGGRVTGAGYADENGYGYFKYPVPDGYLAICDKNGAS